MTPDRWSLAGFVVFSKEDLFFLPVFSRRSDNWTNNYIQCTFSAALDYFELVPVADLDIVSPSEIGEVDPERLLYFGVCRDAKFHLIVRDQLPQFLSAIDPTSLAAGPLAQYHEVCAVLTSSPLSAHVALAANDGTFAATLSAQNFIEAAVERLSDQNQRVQAIRTILRCSRWVTDWSVASIPPADASELQEFLSVDLISLEEIMGRRKYEASQTFKFPESTAHTVRITELLVQLYNLRRQELRLSLLIRYILDNPSRGVILAERYKPRTKYENIVMPLIRAAAKRVAEADGSQRQLIVAQLVQKIYVKYFPIRRGRFLVDFIRTLAGYDKVVDQLASIFAAKQSTYGVGLYGQVIEDLLKSLDKEPPA